MIWNEPKVLHKNPAFAVKFVFVFPRYREKVKYGNYKMSTSRFKKRKNNNCIVFSIFYLEITSWNFGYLSHGWNVWSWVAAKCRAAISSSRCTLPLCKDNAHLPPRNSGKRFLLGRTPPKFYLKHHAHPPLWQHFHFSSEFLRLSDRKEILSSFLLFRVQVSMSECLLLVRVSSAKCMQHQLETLPIFPGSAELQPCLICMQKRPNSTGTEPSKPHLSLRAASRLEMSSQKCLSRPAPGVVPGWEVCCGAQPELRMLSSVQKRCGELMDTAAVSDRSMGLHERGKTHGNSHYQSDPEVAENHCSTSVLGDI